MKLFRLRQVACVCAWKNLLSIEELNNSHYLYAKQYTINH